MVTDLPEAEQAITYNVEEVELKTKQHRTYISSLCCNPEIHLMFKLKILKRGSRKSSKEPTFKTPLTERNVESLNAQDTDSIEGRDFLQEEEEEQERQDASNKLRRSREVQISEWLRLLP